MIRHIKDQAPIAQGDGPICLIMAPTRELVQQISKEIKKFAKALTLTCVAVFGGSGVANQVRRARVLEWEGPEGGGGEGVRCQACMRGGRCGHSDPCYMCISVYARACVCVCLRVTGR